MRMRRWSATAYQLPHTVRRTFPNVTDDLECRIAFPRLGGVPARPENRGHGEILCGHPSYLTHGVCRVRSRTSLTEGLRQLRMVLTRVAGTRSSGGQSSQGDETGDLA